MEILKQKLTSRKLWAAVVAAAITIVTGLFSEELTPEAVSLISKAVMALCVYIFGESIVDVARQLGPKVLPAVLEAATEDTIKAENTDEE